MADAVKAADLLPKRIGGLGRAARQALCNDAKVAGQQLAWGYVASRLDEALREALDFDLFDAFANGWGESPWRGSYAAAMTQPSAEVRLGAHELALKLHPSIALTIAPCPYMNLDF